jgi:hypothetical protein
MAGGFGFREERHPTVSPYNVLDAQTSLLTPGLQIASLRRVENFALSCRDLPYKA